jgi:hypothetical protein
MQLMWAATNNLSYAIRPDGRTLCSLSVENATFAGGFPDRLANVSAASALFGYFAAGPKLRLLSEISLTRLVLNAWCKLKTIQGLRIHLRLLLASK